MPVSKAHLELYHQQGFIAFPHLFDQSDLDQIEHMLIEWMQNELDDIPREHVFYEDKNDRSTLKQIQHLEKYVPCLNQLMTEGVLCQIAETLLEGPVVARNLQYFNKPPGVGKATPPHQDGYYFMLDPPLALTMWLALEPADESNGCIRYIQGSHRRGLRSHRRTDTLGFSQGIADYPNESDIRNEVAICANPGDLLVHDSMTIHRADANCSADRSRRALGFIYYSKSAKEDKAAHQRYQRQLASEMKAKELI